MADTANIAVFTSTRRIVTGFRNTQCHEIGEKLADLVTLEIGWDGYRAKPVAYANAVYAQKLLDEVCEEDTKVPSVVPGANGDLQLEWHVPGYDVEIHIVAPLDALFWCSDQNICPDLQPIRMGVDVSVAFKALKVMTESLNAANQAAA